MNSVAKNTLSKVKFANEQTGLPEISFASKQVTLKEKISFNGVGLHSGKKVKMTLHPADENSGYIFKVKDTAGNLKDIKAVYNNVSSTRLCTTISYDGASVSTTEHILSALYGLNIDNVIIELNACEVPIMDGSSNIFVNEILNNGTYIQNQFKKAIKIKKCIEVKENNKISRISPHDETFITCDIGYNSSVIGNQSISLLLNPTLYQTQISKARTFGFLEDISKLHEVGLALGGSLDNAIVVSENKIVNKEGLRFTDEFVRHKTLDLIGDIALANYQIVGSIYSYHGGHELNNKLLHELFSSNENWELIDC